MGTHWGTHCQIGSINVLHSQINPLFNTLYLLSPLALSYASARVASLLHDIHVYALNVMLVAFR